MNVDDKTLDAMVRKFGLTPDTYTRACMRAALAVLPDGQVVDVPNELHPRTADLVRRFASALAHKLYSAEQKYGYSDRWAEPDWMQECKAQLLSHVAKGDPRDVAAYCAFLWHHGERTALVDHVRDAAPDASGVLFAVEEAMRNGVLPIDVETAFEVYQAAMKEPK